jgi:hypothetical protein
MKTILRMFVVALAPALAMGASPSLFEFSMSGPFGMDGSHYSLKFQEINRTPQTSVVEVTAPARISDLTIWFQNAGLCALAKARGQSSYRVVRVKNEPRILEVTFPEERRTSKLPPLRGLEFVAFSDSQCPVNTSQPKN